jgi:hypothetical protein
MSRCLVFALLTAVFLVAAPAAASAQVPADARAFADIGKRAAIEMSIASVHAVKEPGLNAHCRADHRLRRGTQRQQDAMEELFNAQLISRVTRAGHPILVRTNAELRAVPTTDSVLRSGRAAWRWVEQAYARFSTLPPVRYCSQMRDYVRSGFDRTPEMRRASRLFREAGAWDTRGIDRRVGRAVKRLIELGVSEADADGFDGRIENDNLD